MRQDSESWEGRPTASRATRRPAVIPSMSTRMRRAAVFIGVMIAAVACPGPSHPTPTSAPSAERGGTLRVGVTTSQGRDYDPQVYSGTWMFDELGRCCLLRTLLSYNGQDTLHGGTSLHPDLATALPEISTDDLTWTFRLKTGIHYAPPFSTPRSWPRTSSAPSPARSPRPHPMSASSAGSWAIRAERKPSPLSSRGRKRIRRGRPRASQAWRLRTTTHSSFISRSRTATSDTSSLRR